MPGKSLNEWNCTLEGDFSLADELPGNKGVMLCKANPERRLEARKKSDQKIITGMSTDKHDDLKSQWDIRRPP
jgi:hypothetical protein